MIQIVQRLLLTALICTFLSGNAFAVGELSASAPQSTRRAQKFSNCVANMIMIGSLVRDVFDRYNLVISLGIPPTYAAPLATRVLKTRIWRYVVYRSAGGLPLPLHSIFSPPPH